jgi:hypothetical protein
LFFPDITDRGLISDVRIALNLSLFDAECLTRRAGGVKFNGIGARQGLPGRAHRFS